MPEKNDLFKTIWNQYAGLTPQAEEIQSLLKSRGETVSNDHVAYRAIAIDGFGLKEICEPFEILGYQIKGNYNFEEKKLDAVHLETGDPNDPKVFVSELRLKDLSAEAQKIFEKALYYVEPPKKYELLTAGCLWEASHKNYEILHKESEYAAWFYAYGFCANHFTVNVNLLKSFDDLADLNDFLESKNYKLNDSGGKIKGSKEVFLEQSSTKASMKMVKFSDGDFEIPSCYYEFAKRYPMQDGNLYQGFVTQSADKIFESTN
jgi:hypothetical protein